MGRVSDGDPALPHAYVHTANARADPFEQADVQIGTPIETLHPLPQRLAVTQHFLCSGIRARARRQRPVQLIPRGDDVLDLGTAARLLQREDVDQDGPIRQGLRQRVDAGQRHPRFDAGLEDGGCLEIRPRRQLREGVPRDSRVLPKSGRSVHPAKAYTFSRNRIRGNMHTFLHRASGCRRFLGE